MRDGVKLVYGHDPLCGWCYAIIPAFRRFQDTFPTIPIEVVGGGLFSGDRVQPYANMRSYIPNAFEKIHASTGRRASNAFFSMITASSTGPLASARPIHAIAQVSAIAPERTVSFAHALQEAHFEKAQDMNKIETYNKVTDMLQLPRLNGEAILAANDQEDCVQAQYQRARQLGLSTYPRSLVLDSEENVIGSIDGVYEPSAFIDRFQGILNAAKHVGG